MRLNIILVHEKVGRLPGGVWSGPGDWDVFEATLSAQKTTASFFVALNRKEGLIEFQPKHPDDRKLLLHAFDAMLSYRGTRL